MYALDFNLGFTAAESPGSSNVARIQKGSNSMENNITGTCHCGEVQFELKSDPKLVVNCHCNECKKRNGSAFSTYIAASEDDLNITKGERLLKKYEVESEGIKFFCSECGSPIYNKNYRYPGLYMIFYGTFSEVVKFEPSFNVFCENKHKWVDAINSITSFQAAIKR